MTSFTLAEHLQYVCRENERKLSSMVRCEPGDANARASLNLGLRAAALKSLSSLQRPFDGYAVGIFEVAPHRNAVCYPSYAHRAVF